mgnify:FL=1
MSYDENNPQHRKQLHEYLTRTGEFSLNKKNKTNTEPQRLAKESRSDTEVIVNNGKIQTKKDFIKSLPLEEQPGYDADKDPNLLRRIKYYQGESLGADFDRAIELEDQELKKLGRDPANILQRNRKVQPLVPKRATTKQMTELKGKIDKYKDVHFPKEKPFKKSKPKQLVLPLPELKFDNIQIPEPLTKSPEDIAMEQRFNDILKKADEEKRRNATSGLAGLMGGDPTIKWWKKNF